MSGETITIITAGFILAGLLVGLFAWLRADMMKMEERLRADMDKREERLSADMDKREERLRDDMDKREERLRDDVKQLGERVGRLEHSQARLEGLLEGLREAITRSVPG